MFTPASHRRVASTQHGATAARPGATPVRPDRAPASRGITPDSAELRPGQAPLEIPPFSDIIREIGVILLVCLGVVLIGTLFARF